MGYIRVYSIIVKMNGDVEINPGYEPSSSS